MTIPIKIIDSYKEGRRARGEGVTATLTAVVVLMLINNKSP